MEPEKLKILAIHGYRQNAEVFKQKTGSFRKMVQRWAQFYYITAPHKVVLVEDMSKAGEVTEKDEEQSDQYGWWFNRDDYTFRGIRKGGPAIGFDMSIKLIEETFEKYGPFDGLLGFSQGACFVGLLCDLQQRGLVNINFNFAIMASGFKSGSLPHLKYYDELIDLPVLNIYGESDDIIPKEMSEALGNVFTCATTVVHPGKHYLPAASPQKQFYQEFIKEHYNEKQDRERCETS
ncbi:hypothetical protein PPYR_06063 [Photinus pyralis]|uniref:Serine hydrolase domain-containing protein n=1 Tax=Photinus pyralis TaxID=7054 RepID=A0A5N4ASR5_PHOPY|nr:esterase AGAP003155 [Photinus pyralis]KAB0800323.1 hypothetical protein PPYR_06063 [Photinus pyralis]